MLEKENIDILSLCTHPDSHEKIVKIAVKNGVRAIFCEKPISNSLGSAKEIINQCNSHNVRLAVNHFRRWDEFFINLKNDISNGVFGKIQHVYDTPSAKTSNRRTSPINRIDERPPPNSAVKGLECD